LIFYPFYENIPQLLLPNIFSGPWRDNWKHIFIIYLFTFLRRDFQFCWAE